MFISRSSHNSNQGSGRKPVVTHALDLEKVKGKNSTLTSSSARLNFDSVKINDSGERGPATSRTPRRTRNDDSYSRNPSSLSNSTLFTDRTLNNSRNYSRLSGSSYKKCYEGLDAVKLPLTLDEVKKIVEDSKKLPLSSERNKAFDILGSNILYHMDQNKVLQDDIDRLNERIITLEREIELQIKTTRQAEENNNKIQRLRHLGSINNVEKLTHDIREIEKSLQKLITLAEPHKLDSILEGEDEEAKIEQLINLKFRRLEDLIFGYRKQTSQSHELHGVLPDIVERFGSVNGLLQKYQEALDTIDRLKVREFRLSQDELLKRRPISEMTPQAVATLVVALQNELTDLKAIAKKLMVNSSEERFPVEIEEKPLHDELASKLNITEGEYLALSERVKFLEENNEILRKFECLETEVLKNGFFKMNERIKLQIQDIGKKMSEHEQTIKKLAETIVFHQNLVSQFQREKAVMLRARTSLQTKIKTFQDRAEAAELEAKNIGRTLTAARGMIRLIIEQLLPEKSDYHSYSLLENEFVKNYLRFDNAALIIQNAWRKKTNTKAMHKFVKDSQHHSNILKCMGPITAIDVIAGNLPPVSYRQVVSLLKQYHENLGSQIDAYIKLSTEQFKLIKDKAWAACEFVLCKGRRYVWTQTEIHRSDSEVQTEKVTQVRTPRSSSRTSAR